MLGQGTQGGLQVCQLVSCVAVRECTHSSKQEVSLLESFLRVCTKANSFHAIAGIHGDGAKLPERTAKRKLVGGSKRKNCDIFSSRVHT